MSMTEWAEREVEIACKRERESSTEEGEWDYGCACYESALKAFKCLMEDGHSGFSIISTKNILNRLIDGKPLTPIEDTDDVWEEVSMYRGDNKDGYRDYQCKRMGSLFKYVYDDGRVEYKDVDRVYCVDVHNPDASYENGMITRIIDEMFPIKMPYCANSRYKIICEDFLTDKKNGDFDTRGILYGYDSDGTKFDIYRYFKETDGDWEEIDENEYNCRWASRINLRESEE